MSSIIKPVLGSQLELGHPLATGLVGLWLFNEGSGGQVFDLSGYGNAGTLVADTHWVPGIFGPALDFDGTGDYVDCGTKLGNLLGSANKGVTVNIWMHTDQVGDNDGIFTISSFDGSHGKLQLMIQGGILYFRVNGTAGSVSQSFLDESSYHMITAVVDGTKNILYKDGIYWDSTAYSTAIDFTGLSAIIGGYFSNGFCYDGRIDNVQVYNRAINPSEVALLHREPFAMFERNPIELWVGATSVGAPPAGIPIFRRRRAS